MESPAALKLLTIKEVADALRVHPQTVRGYIKRGELGHVRVGQYSHVAPDQLAAFIDERRLDG